MLLRVNGSDRELGDVRTLSDVMHELQAPDRGIAVAIDGEVVPRAHWNNTTVPDGSSVEIVTAVQGG